MKEILRYFNVLLCFLVFGQSFAQLKYWGPEQCMKMKNVTAVRPSPDGKRVLYTIREAMMTGERSDYVNRIYVANVDGSDTIQLSRGDKNSSNPKWSPDGQWMAFTSDRDGKSNLYILPLHGGESEKITDVKTSVGEFEWSPDGKSIAFIMADSSTADEEKNKKEKNDWYFQDEHIKQNRLYVLSVNDKDSTGKRIQTLLSKEDRNVNDFDWSPDSKLITYDFGKTPLVGDNVNFGDIAIVNVNTCESKLIANTGATEGNPKFSLDGNWIAFECTEDPVVWGGRSHIKIVSVNGGTPSTLAETPDLQPTLLGWSSDDKHVYVAEASKTLTAIYSLSTDSKQISSWSNASADVITLPYLNSTGNYFGFVLQNTSTAGQGFVSSAVSFSPQKITNINADIAQKPVPKTQVVKWKSVDGKEIEGLLTYPLNYIEGKKYPLILNIHGGPAGVFSQSFVASNQSAYPIAAFAEAGYFVLRCNPRGSSGLRCRFSFSKSARLGRRRF
jgi:dipeptidyl aminopeptidase/acylaminoacyl peptidase